MKHKQGVKTAASSSSIPDATKTDKLRKGGQKARKGDKPEIDFIKKLTIGPDEESVKGVPLSQRWLDVAGPDYDFLRRCWPYGFVGADTLTVFQRILTGFIDDKGQVREVKTVSLILPELFKRLGFFEFQRAQVDEVFQTCLTAVLAMQLVSSPDVLQTSFNQVDEAHIVAARSMLESHPIVRGLMKPPQEFIESLLPVINKHQHLSFDTAADQHGESRKAESAPQDSVDNSAAPEANGTNPFLHAHEHFGEEQEIRLRATLAHAALANKAVKVVLQQMFTQSKQNWLPRDTKKSVSHRTQWDLLQDRSVIAEELLTEEELSARGPLPIRIQHWIPDYIDIFKSNASVQQRLDRVIAEACRHMVRLFEAAVRASKNGHGVDPANADATVNEPSRAKKRRKEKGPIEKATNVKASSSKRRDQTQTARAQVSKDDQSALDLTVQPDTTDESLRLLSYVHNDRSQGTSLRLPVEGQAEKKEGGTFEACNVISDECRTQ